MTIHDDVSIVLIRNLIKGCNQTKVLLATGMMKICHSTATCGPVAATLNEDMFNIVILKWRETYESLKETNDYKTLSAAGSLMKSMVGDCIS
jgi:hypothetical protein